MLREMFTWKALVGLLPGSFFIASIAFTIRTIFEINDFRQVALRHEVPISWAIEAYYVFGWSMSYCLNHMGFKEDFIEERKKRKRKIKGWY